MFGRAGRATFLGFAAVLAVAAADDQLARARQLYNQRQFDASIEAAEQARLLPGTTDAADLIGARAYLERFRGTSAPDDLANARERLRRLNPERFPPRERTEYIVGLGEALYFDNAFGAAATVFDTILRSGDLLAGPSREHVLDWWATAVDRDARAHPEPERQAAYQRVRDRMQVELADRPGSAAAAYWLSAAGLGQGDWQAALSAAQAGWLRASLSPNGGAKLREDLDQLVQRGILGERRSSAQAQEALKADWERFKEKWK